jgi:hypothetical protein
LQASMNAAWVSFPSGGGVLSLAIGFAGGERWQRGTGHCQYHHEFVHTFLPVVQFTLSENGRLGIRLRRFERASSGP